MAIDPRSASVPEDPSPSVSDLVARWGHAVMSVGYGECAEPGCNACASPTPWSYSVGLTDSGQPELVLLGATPLAARTLINEVAHRRHHAQLPLDHTAFVFNAFQFRVVDVPDRWIYADQSRMAAWFAHYRSPHRALPPLRIQQILWPNGLGYLPDEPECDPLFRRRHPILREHPLSYPTIDGMAPRSARGRRPRRR